MMLERIYTLFMIMVLSGCNASIHKDEKKVDLSHFPQNNQELSNATLPVKGKIPEWLHGTFIRNGSGILRNKKDSVKHWFDGLAKLDAFYIEKGKVLYSCQFLKSDPYKVYTNTGKFDFDGFAQRAEESSFSVLNFLTGTKNTQINNANVNVAKINGRLVALTETPLPVEFDKQLHTIGYFDYQDNLPKNYSFESAHILADPTTKSLWNFLIDIGLFNSNYQIYTIPNGSSERRPLANIPVSSISYMHSFSLAGKYFVLFDYPFRCKTPRNLAQEFVQSFSWQQKEPTIIYIIDRETGMYYQFETDPFFAFHHINGYEKDNKIIIDIIAYPTADIIWQVNQYPFIKKRDNTLRRYVIDLKNNLVRWSELSEEKIEFTRINDSHISKYYRYFYGVHFKDDRNGLIKYDLDQRKHLYWSEKGCYANEPIFIQNPAFRTEDDGVIVSTINDIENNQSYLLMLDAHTFSELARVEIPNILPFSFHGQFFN